VNQPPRQINVRSSFARPLSVPSSVRALWPFAGRPAQALGERGKETRQVACRCRATRECERCSMRPGPVAREPASDDERQLSGECKQGRR
jgi:hypothetical protein